MEKVAEQHILQKCFKCSRFGVMSTLLKVATIAVTHLAMDLALKNTKQAILGCIKVQLHTYGSHLNQQKKPMAEHLKKKQHGSHLVNIRIRRKTFPGKFFQ